MADYKIDFKDILGNTDGGLDIILEIYPDARESVHKPNRKFKIREEKTASVSLYKKTDAEYNGGYVYLVTDFGSSDPKGQNAIACYCEEYGISFTDALEELAVKYSIKPADPAKAPKATFSTMPATEEHEEGKYYYELNESFTDADIECVLSKGALREIGWYKKDNREAAYKKFKKYAQRYNFFSVKSYLYVKNRVCNVYSANEEFPIFAWVEKHKEYDFAKLYRPKHYDKGKRFIYIGKKADEFIHGLRQAEEEFARREAEVMNAEDHDDNDDAETAKKKRKVEKLDELLYMSGGSDAINAAVLGYWVVWANSETAKLTKPQFIRMSKIATKVMQLQDIDKTGLAEAHAKAMEHLDLFTIELPAELKTYKDRRGSQCKDFRDYLNYYSAYDFKQVIRTALPYRFWDLTPKYKGTGPDRVQAGWTYEFNNVQAYNFLSKNGFNRLESVAKKSGYMFIKVQGNIVTEIDCNEVKNFVHSFLKSRLMDNDLRNSMYRTSQLSEASLSNLPLIELVFNDTGKQEQFFMFPNTTLQITADSIKAFKPGSVDRFIWNEDQLEHHFRPLDESFTIAFDENIGRYDININTGECLFLNYLIQTSRIHWRTELETRIAQLPAGDREAYRKANKFKIDGTLLTQEEILEQKQHLINKIFAIGYMMHRYKDPGRPWAIFAMDNNISEDGGSYGGSGKSILFNVALPKILRKQFYIGGRNPKVTENAFIYDGLSKYHRYVYVDDASEFLNFHFFFDAITGNLKVNPKNTSPYMIPYEFVGKYAFTSNYTLKNIDPSTERRILYSVFSDYYHNKGETSNYNESRNPKDDFGKNMFDDFNREEWNQFYNTMMYCLKFYFSVTEKLDPPMGNVTTRNLKAEMGADFEEWAASYFAEGSSNVDRLIVREESFKDFDYKFRKGWKTQRFSKALRAFCKLNNYELNPKEIYNAKGNRCIIKIDERQMAKDGTWYDTGRKVAKEMMYVRTNHDVPIEVNIIPKEVEDLPKPTNDKTIPNF
jgi:hypothetical protein